MKLVVESYDCLCSLKEFTINGYEARYEDFGDQYDTDRDNAEDYGCGDMQFIPYDSIESNVLEKYKITLEEAREVCEKLHEALSFGQCGWCI